MRATKKEISLTQANYMVEVEQHLRGRKRRSEYPPGYYAGTVGNSSMDAEEQSEAPFNKRKSTSRHHQIFTCTLEGCGKSYSRAEHLSRHQLNHAPKEIFKCDFPGCPREFVRQDLCARHKQRHANHGLQLQDRNSSNLLKASRAESKSYEGLGSNSGHSTGDPNIDNESPTVDRQQSSSRHLLDQEFQNRSGYDADSVDTPGLVSASGAIHAQGQQQTTDSVQSLNSLSGHYHPASYGQTSTLVPRSSGISSNNLQIDPDPNLHYLAGQTSANEYGKGHNESLEDSILSDFSYIEPANKAVRSKNLAGRYSSDAIQGAAGVRNLEGSSDYAGNAASLGDPIWKLGDLAPNPPNTSPSAADGDIAAWLFNDTMNSQNGVFSSSGQSAFQMTNFWDGPGAQPGSDNFTMPALGGAYRNVIQQPQQCLFPTDNPLDLPLDNALLSQVRRRFLIDLIEHRFGEAEQLAIGVSKSEILGGDHAADEHALSMRSMQLYIGSYWYHFHASLPILHKPTFSADTMHPYLLLAIMAIGASCLDSIHGQTLIHAAGQLSNFIAWHLRWQVFMDIESQPPAQLWVFQTLLLLEVFEKMTANRALHERAHIHFATTLTLMRRGSSLVEKPGSSAPSTSILSGRQTPTAPQPSGTQDEWWNWWIAVEATRRVAFAALLIDSTHATMFGHSANMVVHEVCLPLPCDEAVWAATSSAEVCRIEMILHANGIKPVTFIDGLKKTLNGQRVRTNSFGRMIIMAGLLSVAWHMRQHDVQKSLFIVKQSATAPPDGWRGPLANAFDFWRNDFEESLAHIRGAARWPRSGLGDLDEEASPEAAGLVLHHLSHIAMHIDITDCQIFAGANRLLGRTVTKSDYNNVQAKMKQWAPSRGARDAVFHAVKFLRQILLANGDAGEQQFYTARDDLLFNRPWLLYYAALVVWCYGFSLEGALRPFPQHLSNVLDSEHSPIPSNNGSEVSAFKILLTDARSYLLDPGSVGAAQRPEQLGDIHSGRNKVFGVLGLVCRAFEGSRWELLHEASERLKWAIEMLRSG